MTLKIKNIWYDHATESRTYPQGVLTVDSDTKALHVHDGIQPNGVALPTMIGLAAKADVDLGNVTQEDITNLLARYGALTMNDNKDVSEEQRNNMWSKLGGSGAMDFGNTVPENNMVKVGSDHKLQMVDLSTSGAFGFGIDTTNKIGRANNVEYTAERNCYVVAMHITDNRGAVVSVYVDGVLVNQIGSEIIDPKYTKYRVKSTCQQVVAKGQKYRVTGATAITEYGVKPFSG